MPFIAIDPTAAEDLGLATLGAPLLNRGKSLVTMRDEINLGLIGRVDLAPEFYTARINDAYQDLTTSLKYKEVRASIQFQTVAGQPLYLLGQGVRVLDQLSYIDMTNVRGGGHLSKIDANTYRSYRVLDGDAREYFVFGDVLVLWPTPHTEQSFVMEVRVRAQPLVDDDDCPIMPVEWHEGLVLKAKQKALSTIQEWESASVVENEFVGFVRRRLDPSAEEEDTKIVRSSIPSRKQSLTNLDVHYPR